MHGPFIKRMSAMLRRCQPRHDLYTVFGDCMETMALAISNSIDRRQCEAREKRYLEIVGRYDREIIDIFPGILAELALALEEGSGDVLGELFQHLELHNKARGQFFTPYVVSRMMAEVTLGDGAKAREMIEKRGFVTAMEPACGAGSMVIALAEAMRNAGINYQKHLHVTAVDIDPRVVHMAYAQLSLLHIPAHVIVGNSLSLEISQHWFTPAHILGGWNARLAAARHDEANDVPQPVTTVTPAPPPAPPAGTPIAIPRQLRLF